MATPRIQYLVQQVLAQQATEDEWQEFRQLVLQARNQPQLQQVLAQSWQSFEPNETVPEQQLAAIYDNLLQTPAQQPLVKTISIWYRWVAAAAIVLVFLGAAYVWMNRSADVAKTQAKLVPDIAPGGNKAVLTLADGRKIILDSAGNGTLAQEAGATIVKSADGELIYQPAAGAPSGTISYNSMSTPKGGQYHLVLPDGTQVWLNAASSITYPTAFTGRERKVSITGEAYFEVTHDPTKHFIVDFTTGHPGRQGTVEVLGTHFNINAYSDEDMLRATLLQGKVRLSSLHNKQTALLQPGQQAALENEIKPLEIQTVDTSQVIAWKNGLFNFDNAGLPAVLRQLERWYNIEVQYKGKPPAFAFKGKLQRNLNLSQVLRILDEMEVNYEVKGRTLTVLP